MNCDLSSTPFGLLFEEPASSYQDFPQLIYDEEKDMSFIEVANGGRVPFVEHSEALATDTITKVTGEPTDQDWSNHKLMATITITAVINETTDQDPDNEPGAVLNQLPMLATTTKTNAVCESTDKN